MKKPVNVDIHNLFRKFGGDPESYQEIKRDAGEARALQNWPIVVAMKNQLQGGGRSGAPVPRPQIAPEPGASIVRPRAAPPAPVPHRQAEHVDASPTEAPTAAEIPMRSLLGFTKAPVNAVPLSSSGQAPSGQADKRRENEPLQDLFSRLSNPSANDAASSPRNSLRSMLGFTKK